jgi:hypothetical protein
MYNIISYFFLKVKLFKDKVLNILIISCYTRGFIFNYLVILYNYLVANAKRAVETGFSRTASSKFSSIKNPYKLIQGFI